MAFQGPSNEAFRVVVAGAVALVLAMTVGTQAASDRIIGEEDSPPPFLTGSVPFDITIPETTPEASITMPTGMASFPIVNSPAFVSSSGPASGTGPGDKRRPDARRHPHGSYRRHDHLFYQPGLHLGQRRRPRH